MPCAARCGSSPADFVARRPGQVHKHDVGVGRLDLDAVDARQACGQALRQSMVVGQAVDVVVQRVSRGGRQHARLAHAAAGHLANTVRAGNELAAAAQGRAHRRAQPLAEADRHTVEVLRNALRLGARIATRLRGLRHGRVEQPRAIQVAGQAVALRQRRGLLARSPGE
jgi:hypothetical protein